KALNTWSPLHFAVNKGDREMVVRLLDASGPELAAMFAAETGTDGIVGRAVMRKHLKIACWLLEAGAKLTVPPGLTALGDGDYSTAERLAALELFHGQATVSDADMIAAIGTGPGGVLG